MIWAAVRLFEATNETAFLTAAERWCAVLDRHYCVDGQGGYAFTANDTPDVIVRLRAAHEGSVAVSAATGEGVDRLVATIGDRVRSSTTVVDLVVPFDRGDVLAAVHRAGEVVDEEAGEGGMRLRVRLDRALVGRFQAYRVVD